MLFLKSEFKISRSFQNKNFNLSNYQLGIEFFNNSNPISNEMIDQRLNKLFPISLLEEYTNKVITKVKNNISVDDLNIFISEEIQNASIANQFFEERMWGRIKSILNINGNYVSITPSWHPLPDYCDWTTFDSFAEEIIEYALNLPVGLSSIEFESQDISVLFSSPSSGVLLHEVFGHLLEADFFLSSPLKKYLNERIGPKELTIVDDGTMGLHYISKFDDEGTSLQKTIIMFEGVIKTPLVDKRFSSLLDQPLTGNGWKELTSGNIFPRMTTLYALPGYEEFNYLKNSLVEGLLVNSLQGGQVDIFTGDFTLYTEESYLVKNGQPIYKLNPSIIFGNAIEVLKNIVGIGNDLKFSKMICGKMGQLMPVGIGGPSLLISGLKLGGVVNGNNL